MFFELLLQHINTINLKRNISTKLAIKNPTTDVVGFLILLMRGVRTHLNAVRMSAAGEGWTEPLVKCIVLQIAAAVRTLFVVHMIPPFAFVLLSIGVFANTEYAIIKNPIGR